MTGVARDMAGVAEGELKQRLQVLEIHLDRDVLAIVGPILPGLEHVIRDAVEAIPERRETLAIILQTVGGVVEVAERMVTVIRHHYDDVTFIIPDIALSAGTVFAMSGDAIVMDYISCLGPIDPQVQREGKLVPARSYILQYDALIQKATDGTLTNAEFAILQAYDQAELHSLKMACDLSISLLVRWLSTYKFKDWTITEGQQTPVTQEIRERRAKEIATALTEHDRWGSRGRGIPMSVLRDDLKLRIDDIADDPLLQQLVAAYFPLATDFMVKSDEPVFVQTNAYMT